ncbi:hypothetical protein M231_05510 [Tremella mesenterica]|uniref:Uncharacterized protein n=1 Tax=Tremella mesenterica TaxID=5217 RepID=A0A4Q1BHX8_TREME|nr:hypothetical protein M231_05510 [Tremella mesenterica]
MQFALYVNPALVEMLVQVQDTPCPMEGRLHLPTRPSGTALHRAAQSTRPRFPRTFSLSDAVVTLLENHLFQFDNAISTSPQALAAFNAELFNAQLTSITTGRTRPSTPASLPDWHRVIYLAPINNLLEDVNIKNAFDPLFEMNEERKWRSGGIVGTKGPWILGREVPEGAGEKFQPLAVVWEQSTVSILNTDFELLRYAIQQNSISIDETGNAIVGNLGDREESLRRTIGHMWLRLAAHRVRIGIFTTHERSIIFYVNNNRVEVSRVFRRGEGGLGNVLGGLMPLFTALSFLHPSDYLFDVGGPPILTK